MLGLAGVTVLLLGGCRLGSSAKEISLAKFGGAMRLRLNVNRGDRFVYEEVAENVEKSPLGTVDDTETETTELEVIDKLGGDTRVVMTDSAVDADSSYDKVAELQRRHMARLKNLHVEGLYNECGATKSVTAVTTDPLNQDLVAERFEGDAGLHGVVLPPGPVRIGDQWSGIVVLTHRMNWLESLLSKSDAAPQVPVTYRLVGAQEDQGKTLAVIEWSFEYKSRDDADAAGSVVLKTDSGKSLTSSSSKRHGKARVEVATGMVFDAECVATESDAFSTCTEKITIKMKSGR